MSPELLAKRDVLFARMEVLSWRLRQGEDADPARLLHTTGEAMELAPSLSPEDCELLLARLQQAQSAVQAAQERLALRMEALPSERRALRGYVRQHNNRSPPTQIFRRI